MFTRANALTRETRVGLSIIIAALIGAYCYATTKRDQENESQNVWWSTFRVFALSAVAIFIVTGLLGSSSSGSSGSSGSGISSDSSFDPVGGMPDPLTLALAHIDVSPAKF